jgi:hypothetical protein
MRRKPVRQDFSREPVRFGERGTQDSNVESPVLATCNSSDSLLLSRSHSGRHLRAFGRPAEGTIKSSSHRPKCELESDMPT